MPRETPEQNVGGPARGDGPVRIRLIPDPMSVRCALKRLRTAWALAGLNQDAADLAEQVLAEVLNNIVEHAMCGTRDGWIEVDAQVGERDLCLHVRDNGRPMPGQSLPKGELASLDGSPDDLPEGGFGWSLIHTLTEQLEYRFLAGWNCLAFRIPLAPSPVA